MIFNLQNYISGTVMLKVSGPMPEKFINLCMMEKKHILSITRKKEDFIVCIKLQDFFAIRPLVRKSHNSIEVIGYWGLPFFKRKIKRRKMLVVGGILFLLIINILMSYIWFVDIIGIKNVPVEKIKECVYQYGLKPGVLKDSVLTKNIENQVLLTIPEVAWVSVSFTGTRAVVEIVEKTIPTEFDKTPGDIIAEKDGVITEVIALAGKSMVQKGDTVKKGDILIKGVAYEGKEIIPMKTELPSKIIRANGIVKARVWYEGYGESELSTVFRERTGEKKIGITLRVLEHEFHLRPVVLDSEKEFEVESVNKKISWWRNSNIAVEYIMDNHYEVITKRVEISTEEAKEQGKAKALAEVQAMIPETAQVIARMVEVLKTPETNLVRVKVNIETVEDIGHFINMP